MPNIAEKTGSGGRNHATADSTYTRLLTEFSPVAIESAAEHDRALKAVTQLMEKERRSSAETSLLKLLATLIENFEQKRYSMGEASPLDTLKELMRAREIQAKDLWPIFGSKGIASEVLNRKRRISNEMARRLAEVFHVSPVVFVLDHPAQSRIDEIRIKKREIEEGIARMVAPDYRVEHALTRWNPVVRVWHNGMPKTGFILVKGVASTESAERIVGAIIVTLSGGHPESLQKPTQG